MNYGIYVPNFGECATPNTLAALANEAEMAGWDGFFLWDHILFAEALPLTDPWIALAAMALKTKYIRLGPLVTPIARCQPWKLARESVALDHLSVGRLVQGVGIGEDCWREYSSFGDLSNVRTHADMLDEGLEVLKGLWSGDSFSYKGRYYQVDNARFLPPPIQKPNIPIWVAAIWPNKSPLRRAANWNGVFPLQSEVKMTPNDVRDMLIYIFSYRTKMDPFEVILDSQFSNEGKVEPSIIADYAEAGATWWLISFNHNHSAEIVRKRILQGPPKIGK
jgi:alkanesulfonate monooxygenase SsuD/methylene tetrahydromethanopterin reductase-like flavin-dependent oxidoreductase (luciferase family)